MPGVAIRGRARRRTVGPAPQRSPLARPSSRLGTLARSAASDGCRAAMHRQPMLGAGVRCDATEPRNGQWSGQANSQANRWCPSGASARGARSAGVRQAVRRIGHNIERVVRGKHEQIRLALVALVAEGHLLIEDVPGVGKTMLAKAMARSIDCSFRRIQFTPDMLPTDITGVNVFNQERGDFEFRPGAVFANVVLGDEINRASPKTQSALLECMEERQVTTDAETRSLGTPFIVVATQNPVE